MVNHVVSARKATLNTLTQPLMFQHVCNAPVVAHIAMPLGLQIIRIQAVPLGANFVIITSNLIIQLACAML